MYLALQYLAGKLVHQFALDKALDGTRTEHGVVSMLHHIVLEGLGVGESDVVIFQLL